MLAAWIAATCTPGAPAQGPPAPSRLTVDVDWSAPAAPAEIELTEGRVVALAAPDPGVELAGASRIDERRWILGPAPAGKVRARIEAPPTAALIVRAGGQAFRFPLAALGEGPRRGSARGPVEVGVARPAWDALEVNLAGDGTAAPGELVPVTVGFNITSADASHAAVRFSAELRAVDGEAGVWRHDWSEVVATNALPSPTLILPVPLPRAEGTYALELRATWQPLAADGSRLGRLIHRRRGPGPSGSASRRVTLAALASKVEAKPVPTTRAPAEADAVDLSRPRSFRPIASGRSPGSAGTGQAWSVPEAVLAEAARGDRLRGWIGRAGAEAAELGPANAEGLAWTSVGLRAARPRRPHRLTITVDGGVPEALGVALMATDGRTRIALDACASAAPIVVGGPSASFSWLVWPDTPEPILVVVNRSAGSPARLGTISLAELPDVPTPAPAIATPADAPTRAVGLHLADPGALDRFGGGPAADPIVRAKNLADYLQHIGATGAVLPEALADRASRRALDGQGAEDSIGPDRLDLTLRVLGRRGLSAWVELAADGPLPGLPPAGSPEALARGLVRVDRQGRADGPAYHPLHPEVREALARRVAAAASARRDRPALAGVLIRLGSGATLLGPPDTGLDDETYARFVAETFDGEAARSLPGLETATADRFAARARFLEGPGRMPWLTWRAAGVAGLYAELAGAARSAAPGAALLVVTPGLDNSPASAEARRVDRSGLAAGLAWRAVGLDLDTWPAGEGGPVVLRGVGPSDGDLGHDLATNPDLDAPVAGRPARGLMLGATPARPAGPGPALSAAGLADGPEGDEPLGHALAALDPRVVILAGPAVAGHEDRVLRFARVLRALPASAALNPAAPRQPVVVRSYRAGSSTYLALANDSPYPIRAETQLVAPPGAIVVDLGRGFRLAPEPAPNGAGRRLVIDLAPFGVAAIRVGSDRVQLGPVTPHPPSTVLAGMKARYDDLSGTLARLNRLDGQGPPGPANPGFEPVSVRLATAGGPQTVPGWRPAGDSSATVEGAPDRPRSGRGSLRLAAPAGAASALSDPFTPPASADLTLRAWLRVDRPGVGARVRFEPAGASPGSRPLGQAELTPGIDWTPISLRVAGLPTEGIDSARIRFELTGPGTLWVDDVELTGAELPGPDRVNGRRALSAALQAYRDRRYADFARLAGSSWARRVGASRSAEPPSAIQTGAASDLPRDRALR